jgi:hypothetical protein
LRYLLGALAFLNIADGVLTWYLLRQGLGVEGNPLLVPLTGNYGFLTVKIVGVFLCCWLLWDIYRRHKRLAIYTAAAFTFIYLGIVSWNASLIFIL